MEEWQTIRKVIRLEWVVVASINIPSVIRLEWVVVASINNPSVIRRHVFKQEIILLLELREVLSLSASVI